MPALSFRFCLRRLALTLLVLVNLSAASLAAGDDTGQDKQLRPMADGSGLFLLASDARDGDSPLARRILEPPTTLPALRVLALHSRPAQAPRLRVLSSPHQPQAPPLLT